MRIGQAISGAQGNRREFRGFALSRSSYPAGTFLSRHYHEHTVLSFALRGGTAVSLARSTEWCDEGCVLFLVSGDAHANAYPQPAARLHVEVTLEFWTRAAGERASCPASGAVRHPIALELQQAMSAAFLSADDLTGLALSLSLTDMIGVLCRSRRQTELFSGSANRESWLLRLRDFLDANCAEPIELSRLVQVTGRHPAHVSRAFRYQFGKSITQFVRERRVLRAANLLRHDQAPLAQIALQCGFCDQSHFTNVFRRYLGVTPSRLRSKTRDLVSR